MAFNPRFDYGHTDRWPTYLVQKRVKSLGAALRKATHPKHIKLCREQLAKFKAELSKREEE